MALQVLCVFDKRNGQKAREIAERPLTYFSIYIREIPRFHPVKIPLKNKKKNMIPRRHQVEEEQRGEQRGQVSRRRRRSKQKEGREWEHAPEP
jgi:hypothetical protein